MIEKIDKRLKAEQFKIENTQRKIEKDDKSLKTLIWIKVNKC